MKSVPENIYLKTCSNSFPGAQCTSLSTLNSPQGVLKVSSCSSTGFNLQRDRWQMPLLLFSHWQLPVCSWQLYSIPKEIMLLPCSGTDEKSVIFVASSALDIPWLPFLTEAIIALGSKTWRKLGGNQLFILLLLNLWNNINIKYFVWFGLFLHKFSDARETLWHQLSSWLTDTGRPSSYLSLRLWLINQE